MWVRGGWGGVRRQVDGKLTSQTVEALLTKSTLSGCVCSRFSVKKKQQPRTRVTLFAFSRGRAGGCSFPSRTQHVCGRVAQRLHPSGRLNWCECDADVGQLFGLFSAMLHVQMSAVHNVMEGEGTRSRLKIGVVELVANICAWFLV